MSRRVYRTGQVELVGGLEWPTFLTDGPGAYARKHKAKSHIVLGENHGFFIPDPPLPGDKPFEGGIYSVAGLVYCLFADLCQQTQRDIRELDVLVLLPCDSSDDIAWVRLDDGLVTQDLVLTSIDALERIHHLPAYVSVYSALQTELSHAKVNSFDLKTLTLRLPRMARVRAPAFKFNVSKRSLLIAVVGLSLLVSLGWGGVWLFKKLIPKKLLEAPPDQTEVYWELIKNDWQASADRGYARQFWTEVRPLPVLEEGWARQRISCQLQAGCVTTWAQVSGHAGDLSKRYKLNAPTPGANSVTSVSQLDYTTRTEPVVAMPAAQLDQWADQTRTSLVKIDPKVTLVLKGAERINLPGIVQVTRHAQKREFTLSAQAPFIDNLIQALPPGVVIDQVDLVIDKETLVTLTGKFYVE